MTRLIKSLREQNFSKKNLQILLISNLKDNKLRDQAKKWKSLFYDFRYLEVGCKGVNKARNMGIRFASGEILYFLDDDCFLPHKEHLNQLVLTHQKHSSAIGIGGGYKTKIVLKGLNRFYHGQSLEWLGKQPEEEKIASQLIGGNASYKREVFDKGFVFDPQIVFGGSEESLNRSLVENNYKLLFFKELDIYHTVNLKFFEFIKKSFLQGSGSFKNRYQSGQSLDLLTDMKKEAAFSNKSSSFFSFIYNVSFKLGYFWAASMFKSGRFFLFRFVHFLIFIVTSRFTLIKEHIIKRFYGGILLRFFGSLWFYLGRLWFYVGRFYGSILLRFFGSLWFYVGRFYGSILLRFFGSLWFYLGRLWFYVGRFYGSVFLPLIYHSPPMKIYYFSKYQFHKRIKPLFKKRQISK